MPPSSRAAARLCIIPQPVSILLCVLFAKALAKNHTGGHGFFVHKSHIRAELHHVAQPSWIDRFNPSTANASIARIAGLLHRAFNGNFTPRAEAVEPRLGNGSLASPCTLMGVGSGWGQHFLCALRPPPAEALPRPAGRCVFYSFGIHQDYSFDVALSEATGCHGYAFDPTVVHRAMLHKKPPISFHCVAATTLDEQLNTRWHAVTSVPGLRRWQRHHRIAVLKMDCEGCEYALARDILAEDPEFFSHVQQFAVEAHVSRKWVTSTMHVESLGHLFTLLDEAGLALRHAFLSPCFPADEKRGCDPTLSDLGFPCARGIMCQNFLFAK